LTEPEAADALNHVRMHGYQVLSTQVTGDLRPYNALIRVQIGESTYLDFLAEIT